MCVSSVGFAWGVLRGVLGEYAVEQTDALSYNVQCLLVRRLGMRDTLKHGTITVSGFGYFHKNCRFLWKKKCFNDKFRKYNTPYIYVIYQIFPTLYGFGGVAAQ